MAAFEIEQRFFHRYKYPAGRKMPDPHLHGQHELYFLESGKTTYMVGDKLHLLNPSDFIFIPKGTLHLTDCPKDLSITRTLLAFDEECAGPAYVQYIDELKQAPHGHIHAEYWPSFISLFHRLDGECQSQDKGTLEMQRLYLCQLLIMVSRHRQRNFTIETNDTIDLIQDAARYINMNYQLPLLLEDLAHQYALSPGHFSKLFKKVTGAGVREYINLSRIAAAQRLLEASSMPITQIALSVGFNDSNYFARVFRHFVGVTPKKYALQNKTAR